MKKSRFLGKVASHITALFLGVILTFSTMRVMSSEADTLPLKSIPNNQNNTDIALQQNKQTQSPAPTSNSFVGQAVAQTGPAVVRIDTERTVSRRVDPFFDDPFFREFFGDRFRGQIPRERQVRGQGSGFITDKSGIVLTNAHVVSRADRVTVTLKDGREFEGVVKGTDEVTDLAVVKIDYQGEDLPVAPLGNSSQVQVGDWAIAVGNPVGLNNTVTLGIISTLTRSSAQVGIPDKRIDFLQTDAAINPGNSGGPLLNEVKSITNTLAAGKQVPHPYIGVQMVTLTPELAKQNNQDPNSPFFVPELEGVLVLRVLPNTPAERSGIRRGDVILEIDGAAITSAEQLQSIVESSGLNSNLQFKIQRGDRTLKLRVSTAQLEGMS